MCVYASLYYITLCIILHKASLGQLNEEEEEKEALNVTTDVCLKNNPHIENNSSLSAGREHISVPVFVDLDLRACICPLSPTVVSGLSNTWELKGTLLGLWHHTEIPAEDPSQGFQHFINHLPAVKHTEYVGYPLISITDDPQVDGTSPG